MKKIYLFLLIGLAVAYVCRAQSSSQEITFYSWDGTKALNDGDSLEFIVGETKEVKYTVPAGVDVSKYELSVAKDSAESKWLFLSEEGNVKAFAACTGYVGFYVKEKYKDSVSTQVLKVVKIVAKYRASGALHPTDSPAPLPQVYYSIDADWRLQFWIEKLDSSKMYGNTKYYEIPDYGTRQDAPWYAYRDQIREIDLNNIDRIGTHAFCDMSKIHYVQIMDSVRHMGTEVFLGCKNLTLEVNRFNPNEVLNAEDYHLSYPKITTTNGNSIIIGYDESGSPVRPELVIVNVRPDFSTDAINEYSDKTICEWGLCTVSYREGPVVNDIHMKWVLGRDSFGTVSMTIENDDPANPRGIPDRYDGIRYGWEELGNVVKELKISDGINYIGKYAMISLRGLEAIQFHQWDHPLDSMHCTAFDRSIRPWKFAFGDPQDGPVRPPKIIGDYADWTNIFSDSTVLYVPDSLVDDGEGGKVKCVKLYKKHGFWGTFKRITDRTVDSAPKDTSIILSWLPLEGAEGYILTVMEINCEVGKCDTATIVIPATGKRGLVDWSAYEPVMADGIAARRAPKGNDGSGGMTLTITINSGSGTSHDKDVETNVSGMESEHDYAYKRIVIGDEAGKYSKAGVFISPDKSATGLEETDMANDQMVNDQMVHVYDILGRPMGSSISALPEGLYIIVNGTKRTTILLQR